LAEDSRNDVDMFRRALRKTGLQNPLHVVHTGDEVISYLLGEGQYADRAQFPMPDLLLLDSQMPGKSGCEVLQWFRERPEFKAVTVIMLGGSGSPNEEDEAFRLGAVGYHIKPQTPGELEELVKRICGA
jgi:CheY-like chemotaxis protein